jgi:nickel transport protein
MKLVRITILVLCMTLFLPTAAFAHKMLIDALSQEDGTVLIEALFQDGSPAKNCKVEIFAEDGTPLKEGVTDENGRFVFKPEGAATYKAVVTGTLGHRAEVSFVIEKSEEVAEKAERPSENIPPKMKISTKEQFPWLEIIAGLGFIFGLSSFILCLKLRSELKNAFTRNR